MTDHDDEGQRVRLMALELVVADMLATVSRATVNPVASLTLKRTKFRWLFEGDRKNFKESIPFDIQPEELQKAVDDLFAMSEVIVKRRDLT